MSHNLCMEYIFFAYLHPMFYIDMSKRLSTAARPMSKSGRGGTTLQRPPTGFLNIILYIII